MIRKASSLLYEQIKEFKDFNELFKYAFRYLGKRFVIEKDFLGCKEGIEYRLLIYDTWIE